MFYIYIYIYSTCMWYPFSEMHSGYAKRPKKKLSLASLKICFQGESSLTDHNLNRGESPRYHQSNDTVPPSFNLKIFSWVQTWEISRSVFGVFEWVVMVSFENEKFLQNRTVCFWLFHLTAANIISTSIWVPHHLCSNHTPFTHHSCLWIDSSRHVHSPKLVLRILPHLGNGDACTGLQIMLAQCGEGTHEILFIAKPDLPKTTTVVRISLKRSLLRDLGIHSKDHHIGSPLEILDSLNISF